MRVHRRSRHFSLRSTAVNPAEPPCKCVSCGEALRADEFYVDRSKASGRRSFCKSCDRARARRYYGDHRAQVVARVQRAQAARKAS